MRDNDLPTAQVILDNASRELDRAYRALGDAGDWLRSDWQPAGSALTADQAARRDYMWQAINTARQGINRAKQ